MNLPDQLGAVPFCAREDSLTKAVLALLLCALLERRERRRQHVLQLRPDLVRRRALQCHQRRAVARLLGIVREQRRRRGVELLETARKGLLCLGVSPCESTL